MKSILVVVKSKLCCVLLTGMLASALFATAASATGFDFDDEGDFGIMGSAGTGVPPDSPVRATLEGLTLDLTALTGVQNEGNLDLTIYDQDGSNPNGLPGIVHFGRLGAGVKSIDDSGSQAISGLGGFGDEALVLSFDQAIVTLDTVLIFDDFDPVKAAPFIYLDNTNSPLAEALVEAALVQQGGMRYSLAFADIAGLLPSDFSTMYVRAQAGHFVIASGDFTIVPQPGTALLLGAGLAGLALQRRRRATH